MNEQLEKVLQKAIQQAETNGNFKIEEYCQVTQEYILYSKIVHFIFLILAVLMFWIGWKLPIWIKNAAKESYSTSLGEVSILILSFIYVAAIPIFIYNLIRFLEVVFTPNIYLLEYFPK